MKSSPTSIVPVIAKSEGKNMSRLQKQFNSRIKKIRKLKTQIEETEQAMPEIRSLIHRELQPLQDKINLLKAQIVEQLDKAWEMKFFRHKEKAKLQELIRHNAYELIQAGQDALEAIYDKHSSATYQEEAQLMNESGKQMASAMFKDMFDMDLDLDDVDMNDFGQVSERLFASMEERAQQEEEKQKNKKKTKAQQKREEKIKAENEHISKTSRAVYTRLVKEFHPDKEADEEQRLWKTEVMKRVTQAYKKDDFFGLLSLEIELMQGHAHDLGELPDDQLKYYNKMLKEQVDELQMQWDALTNPPPPFDSMAPYLRDVKHAPKIIQWQKRDLQETLSGVEGDLKYLSDKKNLRTYLRDYELEEDRYDEDDLFFFGFPE
jgi:hypothetical protein